AEDGIRDFHVTGVQTCALPICCKYYLCIMILAERYHDISCGHRVVGHEGKCRFLHGHNYRIHFTVAADQLDEIGRVVDFSVIKRSEERRVGKECRCKWSQSR